MAHPRYKAPTRKSRPSNYGKEDVHTVSQESNPTLKESHPLKYLEKNLSAYDKLTQKEKIIFLAGVFDGEGSFGIWSRGKGKKKMLQVKVETTDADMVARFHELYGGIFFVMEQRNIKHKHVFRWKITGQGAWKPLKEMIPYMCKRRKEKYISLLKPCGFGLEDWGSLEQVKERL